MFPSAEIRVGAVQHTEIHAIQTTQKSIDMTFRRIIQAAARREKKRQNSLTTFRNEGFVELNGF